MATVPPIYDNNEQLIDFIVELLGRMYKRSQIVSELRTYFPDISYMTVGILINRAREKIRDTLNLDPSEYRGKIVECLETIIRNPRAKNKDKIKAAEMLSQISGVNQASLEDPVNYAKRVAAAILAADNSVQGIKSNTQTQEEQKVTQKDSWDDEITFDTKTEQELRIARTKVLKEQLHKEDNPSPEDK